MYHVDLQKHVAKLFALVETLQALFDAFSGATPSRLLKGVNLAFLLLLVKARAWEAAGWMCMKR